MEEWIAKCGLAGTSKNCETLRLAQLELQKEYEAKAEERARKAEEDFNKRMDALEAKEQAEYDKWKAEQQEKERKAKEQQDN